MEMIQINLLPKEFRKKSGGMSIGKAGYYAIGATAGVIVMIVVISLYQMFQLKELEAKMEIARYRTQQLQKDIAIVDGLIEVKEKIMQRMEAVDKLDRHRTVWVRILEDISNRVPEFTWLSLVKEVPPVVKKEAPKRVKAGQAPDTTAAMAATSTPNTRPVQIEGFSFTLNSLAQFMIKLMRSNFFSDVEMVSAEEVQFQKQKAYNYQLSATLHYLSDDELKKLLENESGSNLLASF